MRVRHLRLLVLAFALAGIGYRLYPQRQPTIWATWVLTDVCSPAPGVVRVAASVVYTNAFRNGKHRWLVTVWSDQWKCVGAHYFNCPEQSLKDQPARLTLAPTEIKVPPGDYEVLVECHEDIPATDLQGKAIPNSSSSCMGVNSTAVEITVD